MTDLDMQLDQNRRRAHTRIGAHRGTLDRIRSDRTLTDYGKADRIAREYVEARRDVTALRREADRALHARKALLERSLFGWGVPAEDAPTLTARRESNKMAEDLENPGDALVAYETAKRRSDDLHVHAIVARALEAGWQQITNDYFAERPNRAAEAQELATILNLLHPSQQFLEAANYSLPKPNELASVDLGEYERELTSELNDVQAAFARQLYQV